MGNDNFTTQYVKHSFYHSLTFKIWCFLNDSSSSAVALKSCLATASILDHLRLFEVTFCSHSCQRLRRWLKTRYFIRPWGHLIHHEYGTWIISVFVGKYGLLQRGISQIKLSILYLFLKIHFNYFFQICEILTRFLAQIFQNLYKFC